MTGTALAGIEDAVMSPIRDSKGKPQKSKVWGDAEAVTRLGERQDRRGLRKPRALRHL